LREQIKLDLPANPVCTFDWLTVELDASVFIIGSVLIDGATMGWVGKEGCRGPVGGRGVAADERAGCRGPVGGTGVAVDEREVCGDVFSSRIRISPDNLTTPKDRTMSMFKHIL
jgi:hypothetical protein